MPRFSLKYADRDHGGFNPNALFSLNISDHHKSPIINLNRTYDGNPGSHEK
jgi:hypothetical protein